VVLPQVYDLKPASDLPSVRSASHIDGHMQVITGQVHCLPINPGPGPLNRGDGIPLRLTHDRDTRPGRVLGVLRRGDDCRQRIARPVVADRYLILVDDGGSHELTEIIIRLIVGSAQSPFNATVADSLGSLSFIQVRPQTTLQILPAAPVVSLRL